MAREDAATGLRAHDPATGARLRRTAPRLVTEETRGGTGGAARPPTVRQWAAGVLVGALSIAGLVLAPGVIHDLLFLLFALAAATRLAAALIPLRSRPVGRLAASRLPRYTIIAPLYREAGIAADLVAALDAINYPRNRLQALIVLESDDAETWDALAALPLPAFIQVLAAPPGDPRTKPRACNIALERATGDLLTIYDAEDRPHPGQLREAAARFAAASPRLACLQAPLRVDPDERLLPAQFALEYAVQFEVMLPALARFGAPFPLGGTSNHFRVAALKAVGGWDAWNVTEDADLGFRLAAEGYAMDLLDSPTFEPAPDTLADWIPQRTRWVKGYMQTFGVQSCDPPHWRTGAAFSFAVTLGATIVAAFLHGPLIAWAIVATVLGLASGGAPWLSPWDGALLAAGWSIAAFAGAVGLRRAGLPLRVRDLVFLPLYWPLQSLAAAHALYQLCRRPFHWDKTPHARRTGQVPV